MDAGEIIVKLSGDSSGLTSDIEKSIKKIEALKGVIEGMGQEIKRTSAGNAEVKKLGDALIGVANGANQAATASKQTAAGFSSITTAARELGFALSSVAIIGYLKNLATTASHMEDLSKRTEIAVSTLVKLRPILETSGTSVDAFANSVFRARVQIGQIKETTDPTYKAIKELEINFNQLAAASPVESIRILFTAISKVGDSARRDALAMTFFSNSFKQIKPAVDEMLSGGGMGKVDAALDAQMKKLAEYQNKWVVVVDYIAVRVSFGMGMIIKSLEDVGGALAKFIQTKVPSGGILEWIAKTGGVWNLIDKMKEAPAAGGGSILSKTDWAKGGIPVGDILGKGGVPDRESQLINPEAVARSKAAANAIAGFVDSLKKQADAQRVSNLETTAGASASRKLAVDLELASFELELLRETQHRLTVGQRNQVRELANEYLELADSAEKAKDHIAEMAAISKSWVSVIDEITEAQEKWAQIKMDPVSLGMDDLSKTLDEIARKYTKLIVEMRQAAIVARAAPEEVERVERRLRIEQAMEQVRARVAYTGEGEDPAEEARKRAMEFGASLAQSMTSGLNNTLMGIETGQQTLAEGMKNLLRNMMLELQGALIDKTILQPLQAFAGAFIGGLVGALDDAAQTDLKDWAEGLGKQVRSWLGTGLQAIVGAFGGNIGFGGAEMPVQLSGPPMARGGPIPSFAGGGLFIGHPGEFVVNAASTQKLGMGNLGKANATGEWPGGVSNTPAVTVEINGDITPRQPNMTPDQIIKVTAGNITNDGMIMSAIEQRMRMKGR
jgi:phage gp16-like protein